VSDDQCVAPVKVGGDTVNVGVLDLDEIWTYTCSTELFADTTNIATVESTDSLGNVVSDTATAFVNIINPAIAIDKQASSTTVALGQVVTYTYTATNPGDDPLSDVGVDDDRCSPLTFVMGDSDLDGQLDPDETWTYTCSMALSADTINTAIVTGTDSLGAVVSDTATLSVDVVNPDINIDKQAEPEVIYAAELVTYTYIVSNPQNDALMNLSVDDDHCSGVSFVSGDGDGDEELDPGENWTYTCSMTLFADTINVATAIGYDPLSGVVSDTATAFVDVINPGVSLDKRANSTTVYAGGMVTYTYTVMNPGDDPLSDVGVSDDRCSTVSLVGGDNDQDNELDPGEIWIHTCSMTLLADTTNTAIVTGTDSLGAVVSDTATLSVNVINPDINLDKQASSDMVYAGDTVTYTYTVDNPQDDALTDVGVSDDRCSGVDLVGGDTDLDNELDPGENWTYACAMALWEDTTNVATVVGTDSLSDVVSDTATAFVSVISPAIGIDKQASALLVDAGDTVTYTYTIINPGDDPLSSISVDDDQCSPVNFVGGDTDNVGVLDPDETWTYTCSMVLLANTTNVAVAAGVDSLDGIVSDTDTVFVLVSGTGHRLYLPLVLNLD
jgi:uncharacterized repeat protein (TIGR01451 family)